MSNLAVCACRLRGDIVQYNINDPENPKLAGRVWLGGCCRKGGPYKVWPYSACSSEGAVLLVQQAFIL